MRRYHIRVSQELTCSKNQHSFFGDTQVYPRPVVLFGELKFMRSYLLLSYYKILAKGIMQVYLLYFYL